VICVKIKAFNIFIFHHQSNFLFDSKDVSLTAQYQTSESILTELIMRAEEKFSLFVE